jgi:hypothetical protein
MIMPLCGQKCGNSRVDYRLIIDYQALAIAVRANKKNKAITLFGGKWLCRKSRRQIYEKTLGAQENIERAIA